MKCFDCKKDGGVFYTICKSCYEKFQAEINDLGGAYNSIFRQRDKFQAENKILSDYIQKRQSISEYDEGWMNGSDAQNEADHQFIIKPLKEEIEQLQAELEKYRFIPVSERLPEYIKEFNTSKNILILDGKAINVGNYQNGRFVYWSGSWCNIDERNSQKTITHWKPIILPK